MNINFLVDSFMVLVKKLLLQCRNKCLLESNAYK
jgi:hypothetical protein